MIGTIAAWYSRRRLFGFGAALKELITVAGFLHLLNQEEAIMKLTVIALAAGFALMSSFALAQTAGGTAGGSSKAGGPAATAPAPAGGMSGSTTGTATGKHMKKHKKHHRM